MSAAAARRRKQLAKKAALNSNSDPITDRMNSLLNTDEKVDESIAYEALQLAQSQVRRHVKSGEYEKATLVFGYDVSMILLQKHARISVASQHLALLAQVLKETHTVCDAKWIQRIVDIDKAYLNALDSISKDDMEDGERARLMRLHLKFLKSALSYSEILGNIRHGALEIHKLIGDQSWRLAKIAQDNSSSSTTTQESSNTTTPQEEDDEDGQTMSVTGLKCDAITHLALAEKPNNILELLRTLPKPTRAEITANHDCSPALRDELLTRANLVFLSVQNLRDAHTLITTYVNTIEERTSSDLKKSYMSKTDGKAPSHAVFNSMLFEICRKDKKTGPLYNWLLRSFSTSELEKMYKPELLKGYTAKIGRVYFDIQPPPSMLATIENMMSMMGGGPAGGMAGGGINPAMMQAMMGGGGMGR